MCNNGIQKRNITKRTENEKIEHLSLKMGVITDRNCLLSSSDTELFDKRGGSGGQRVLSFEHMKT